MTTFDDVALKLIAGERVVIPGFGVLEIKILPPPKRCTICEHFFMASPYDYETGSPPELECKKGINFYEDGLSIFDSTTALHCPHFRGEGSTWVLPKFKLARGLRAKILAAEERKFES